MPTPCDPEVQAVHEAMTGPLQPNIMAMLAAQVWLMNCR